MRGGSPLLRQALLPLYALLMLAAVLFLLRGHHEPGGGFIGGLMAVAASSLAAVIRDPATARRWQGFSPRTLAVAGVVLALGTGLGGPLLGLPVLTHLGSGFASTVLLFDLGVFLAVWGALTGYVYALLEAAP